jgi:hypothetical protein
LSVPLFLVVPFDFLLYFFFSHSLTFLP